MRALASAGSSGCRDGTGMVLAHSETCCSLQISRMVEPSIAMTNDGDDHGSSSFDSPYLTGVVVPVVRRFVDAAGEVVTIDYVVQCAVALVVEQLAGSHRNPAGLALAVLRQQTAVVGNSMAAHTGAAEAA